MKIDRYKMFESTNQVDLEFLKVEKSKISEINGEISKYLNQIYGPFGWSYAAKKEIQIPRFGIIDSDHIDLFINNYTIFKSVAKTYRLKTEENFIDFVKNNLEVIYNYNSKFFIYNSLPIVIRTKRKGNRGEQLVLQKFKDLTLSKGFDVELIIPTLDEDIKGVDSKFLLSGKTYTIQVKPMSRFKILGDKISIESPGCLTLNKYGIMPDYLFFYSDKQEVLFLKNLGIVSTDNSFESPVKNLILEK
jgi:hypothetical protein